MCVTQLLLLKHGNYDSLLCERQLWWEEKGEGKTEKQKSTENDTPQTAGSSEIYAPYADVRWTLKKIKKWFENIVLLA